MVNRNQIQNKNNSSGILLLAKQSGETSFSSLTAVKRALDTGKVGHTGTLDSFADGLLVVLTGSLTRLVPHITNFSKTYLALIEFGKETDTLDPTGNVIREGTVPSEGEVMKALEFFKGEIDQIPPAFSALHVNGKRASDLMRSGKNVELPARKITIHSIKLLDFYEQYALIEVNCSKGTYIRSLARDIAAKCGSCAHLAALRRTSVGPFNLKDAAGFTQLGDFTISSLLEKINRQKETGETGPAFNRRGDTVFEQEVKDCIYPMTISIAQYCGFTPAILSRAYVQDFSSGRRLKNHSFYYTEKPSDNCEFAVFYPDLDFAGVIKKSGRKLSYGFVNPVRREKIKIYSWEQIYSGKFSEDFKKKGTAISIGSFDGTHIGHDAIFDSLISRKEYVPGIVTFRHSTRSVKAGDDYPGDVSTLSQRMEFFIQKGFAFVVVIDFSDDFVKISGTDFLSVLRDNCNLKYLVEGEDFRCGHKGLTDVTAIRQFCMENTIDFDVHSFVDYLDKKVSSSRIRQDVLDRSFDDVKIMRHKSFEIDCAGFEWRREVSDGQNWLVCKKQGMQVFPSDGEYTVAVNMVISGSEEISVTKTAVCKLESGLLRVLDSDGSLRGFVRSIQFDYSQRK